MLHVHSISRPIPEPTTQSGISLHETSLKMKIYLSCEQCTLYLKQECCYVTYIGSCLWDRLREIIYLLHNMEGTHNSYSDNYGKPHIHSVFRNTNSTLKVLK
jgi:sorbitol-specific phosphotransferase system component IIA